MPHHEASFELNERTRGEVTENLRWSAACSRGHIEAWAGSARVLGLEADPWSFRWSNRNRGHNQIDHKQGPIKIGLPVSC